MSKLIKCRDGTMKCECRADFVIVHNGDVECASCGVAYGNIKMPEKPFKIIKIYEEVVERSPNVLSIDSWSTNCPKCGGRMSRTCSPETPIQCCGCDHVFKFKPRGYHFECHAWVDSGPNEEDQTAAGGC